MKKVLLVGLFIAFCATCWGQEQFFKSSIITKDGEIEQGYLSNLYDSKNIAFKKTPKSAPIHYKPSQVMGFTLGESLFETKIVRVFHYKYGSSYLGVTGEAPSLLTIDTAKGQTTDTLFLQKIISGVVNLYKVHYMDNSIYLFVEKDNVIRELPRQYYLSQLQGNSKTDVTAMLLRKNATLNYDNFEFKTYLDTLALVCNDAEFLKKLKSFDYSEKKIMATVASYNRMMGVPNSGIVKSKIPRHISFGGSVGKVAWKRDVNFKYESTTYNFAANAYVLMPLSGLNRKASAKIGVNYFVYGNERRSMTILSGSFGLRYATLSGPVRPYFGFSLAISEQFLNNKPYSTLVPTILETGVVIPVREFYLTAGVCLSPVKYSLQNGYQLIAWNVGIIF